MILSFIPTFILACSRYLYPAQMDRIFFRSLLHISGGNQASKSSWAHKYAVKQLRLLDGANSQSKRTCFCCPTFPSSPRGTVTTRLMKYINRTFKKGSLLVLCTFFSFLPFVGRLIWPFVTLWFVHDKLGSRAAIYLFALGLLSPYFTSFLTGKPLSFVLATRSFGRELLEPYLCRSQLDSVQVLFIWSMIYLINCSNERGLGDTK